MRCSCKSENGELHTQREYDTRIPWRETGENLEDFFEGFLLISMGAWSKNLPTCSLLGGMGDGGREGVVLDFGGGGEMISSVSSALPKDPSSMLAFE